jgi:RNA polymerase sigma-B factor
MGAAAKDVTDHAADLHLFAQYRRERDAATREQLVRRFLPLARGLAWRYRSPRETTEDLEQVAALALLRAIDRFDPDQGKLFSSFAVPTILGELKRHFRDHGWALHLPRDVKERVLRAEAMLAMLTRELGRSPSPRELAAAMGTSEEHVLEALDAAASNSVISMNVSLGGIDEDDGPTVGDTVAAHDPGFAEAEARVSVEALLRGLPARERTILRLRFEEGLSQQQIGERIGVSQMHVSRLLRQTLARLRLAAESSPAAEAVGGASSRRGDSNP